MISGGRLNKKDGLTRYGDSHVKDKTVSPTVLSLTWESPYLGKTVFILRRGPDISVMEKLSKRRVVHVQYMMSVWNLP